MPHGPRAMQWRRRSWLSRELMAPADAAGPAHRPVSDHHSPYRRSEHLEGVDLGAPDGLRQ
jgi:hypothetical protein